MNKTLRNFCLSLFLGVVFCTSANAQWASGDYVSYCGGAGPTWCWAGSTAGHETWGIYDGTSIIPTLSNPTQGQNAWIRTGHTISITGCGSGPYQVLNLNVQSGGKLWGGGGTDLYLEVYGSSLVCDGTIGNGSTFDCLSFSFEGASCTVSGTGSFDASRIRKNRNGLVSAANNTNVTFARNINLHFPGTDIYNNSATFNVVPIITNLNVTISAGDTLNLDGWASIDSVGYNGLLTNAFGFYNHGGSYTINGTMIAKRIYLKTDNATTSSSCRWIVNSGGYLKTDTIYAGTSVGAGKDSLTVNSGGTLEISGVGAWTACQPGQNVYQFKSGSTVIYSALGNQVVRVCSGVELGTTAGTANALGYGNLILTGSGTKSTNASTLRVQNDLTIDSPAVLAPAAASIAQVGGNWIDYAQGGFTEGTSTVQFNGLTASPQYINCPGGETFNNLTYQNSALGKLTFNTNVSVASTLTFVANGMIDLNSKTLTMLNALPASISGASTTRNILSEKTDNSSKITWKIGTTALNNRNYVFPFGNANGDYVPVTVRTGTAPINMGDVTISTYGTGQGNIPLPTTPVLVTNLDKLYGVPGVNDSDAVADRFWEVEATSSTAIADLTMTYAPTEIPVTPYNIPTDIAAQWYDSAYVDTAHGMITTKVWRWPTVGTGSGNGVTITNNTQWNVPWALVNDYSPLPIELLDFTAKLHDEVVDVNWSTSSEINNDYFTVEKSVDGRNFVEAGRVKGAGNSTNTRYYSMTDRNPYQGLSYYRLRQTDFDGHFKFSKLVSVLNKGKNSAWYIFPNPATDVIHIGNMSGVDMPDATLEIFSPEGTLIRSMSLSAKNQSLITVDIKDFSNGIYIGKITDSFNQEVFKIIKN